MIPIVTGELGTVTKGFVQRLEDLKITGRVVTIQIYSIVEISENTEKSPGDSGRKSSANAGMKKLSNK